MEKTELLKYAKIAATTYDNPPDAKKKFQDLGFDIVEFFDMHGAQAYLIKKTEVLKDEYVLSFRGTEVKQTSDVVADLSSGKNLEACGGKVHYGFRNELNKIWPAIERAVSKITTLNITGHSLGAAMATIAASRLQSKTQALVTFGSPRVGTAEFVASLKVPHYRVQNNNDVVTKVPLWIMGFRHHGTCVYLNFYGKIRNLTTWQRVKDMLRSRRRALAKLQMFKGVYDHLMAHYIEKLEKGE